MSVLEASNLYHMLQILLGRTPYFGGTRYWGTTETGKIRVVDNSISVEERCPFIVVVGLARESGQTRLGFSERKFLDFGVLDATLA